MRINAIHDRIAERNRVRDYFISKGYHVCGDAIYSREASPIESPQLIGRIEDFTCYNQDPLPLDDNITNSSERV